MKLLQSLIVMAVATVGCSPQNYDTVKIGVSTYVCLSIGGNFTVLRPIADDYARSVVSNSYVRNSITCLNELISVQSMGVVSPFRKSFCSAQRFFPILTVIISVELGKVTRVDFDDGCYFTNDEVAVTTQQCLPNAFANNSTAAVSVSLPSYGSDTAITQASCAQESETFCDLAVYVAWTGRDVDGNYFTSAGRRFSVLSDYALQTQFKAMQEFL